MPEPFDDACPWQTKAGLRQHLGDDQFAVPGAGSVAFGHPVLGLVAAIGRDHTATFAILFVDADDTLAAGIEPTDDSCFDLAIIERHQSRRSASPDQ